MFQIAILLACMFSQISSAGIGRTAVFIGLCMAVEQVKREQSVDLVSIVNKLRQQRMKMIQTEARMS